MAIKDIKIEKTFSLNSVLGCSWSGKEIVFEINLEFEDFVPAYISGPPEDCYPSEGGTVSIYQISFILDPELNTIPQKRMEEIIEIMKDLENHVYDDEIFQLAQEKVEHQRELSYDFR
jgi:hypothetical protein